MLKLVVIQAMDHIERFVSEIVELLDDPPQREELALTAARKVAALIGNVGVTETSFAPRGDVANALREARTHISQRIAGDGANKQVVLLEIDKTLAVVGRNDTPPPATA
jgi:hypothetical protein